MEAELLHIFVETPWLGYFFIFGFFIFASATFPVPEEVWIIGLSSIIYLSHRPSAVASIDAEFAALACTAGVVLSDFVIFFLGYYLNSWVLKSPIMRRQLRRRKSDLVKNWIDRYGHFAAAIFRFIPTMRWPGHLACGLFKVSPVKFMIADTIAGFSYIFPQVLLISYYGKEILEWIESYRYGVGLFVVLTIFLVIHFRNQKKTARHLERQGIQSRQ